MCIFSEMYVLSSVILVSVSVLSYRRHFHSAFINDISDVVLLYTEQSKPSPTVLALKMICSQLPNSALMP